MKKNTNIVGYVVLTFLLSIFFQNIFTKDKTFSNIENRHLQEKPNFSILSLQNNMYINDLNKYVEDQFAMKTKWMNLKTTFEKSIGIKKIKNIYFGKDKKLIEEAVIPDEDFVSKRIENIYFLKNKYKNIPLRFVLVPNKISFYKNETTSILDQKKLYYDFRNKLGNSYFVTDSYKVLNNHKDEPIFFKTDHHYTSLGAKYIYENIYNKKDIKYKKYLVNNKFLGTSANQIAYYKNYDKLEIYTKEKDASYYLTYNDSNTEYTSLYDLKYQFSSNPYEIYFGGNKGLISIKTDALNKDKLLIIKDSYANSFIPFILDEYREITIVDPRYFYDDIDTIIKEKDINKILLFYNMNTFFEDTSFDRMINSINK